MNKTNIITMLAILLVLAGGYILFEKNDTSKSSFEKKQECSQYVDLANKKITESGRVLEKDSFTVNEIFYSPKIDSCLYAYTIHTIFDPKEIYTIDDLFGGSVYTGGLAEDAEQSFYQKIEELKK